MKASGIRPKILPPAQKQFYEAGLTIKEEAFQTAWFFTYLSGSRVEEIVPFPNHVIKRYKRNKVSKVRELVDVIDCPLTGVRPRDFSYYEDGRPIVQLFVLKKGRPEWRKIPLVLAPRDVWPSRAEEFKNEFQPRDWAMWEIIKAYIAKCQDKPDEPIWPFHRMKLYHHFKDECGAPQLDVLVNMQPAKRGLNPHLFRHARATHISRYCKDPVTLKNFFRWASIEQAMTYLDEREETLLQEI